MQHRPSPPWHRRRWADPLLRATGILLLLAAWGAGVGLYGRAARADALDDLLALVAFMGSSAGLATTLLGAHLFDRVPVASRWGGPIKLDW